MAATAITMFMIAKYGAVPLAAKTGIVVTSLTLGKKILVASTVVGISIIGGILGVAITENITEEMRENRENITENSKILLAEEEFIYKGPSNDID